MKVKENIISVVIPIYNVEKYLDRCVKSIINQTYKNIEIILVDDGSKDNCPLICDRYSKLDKRVKVIHKTNGGLSDARNYGIDAASGKYITFVDGDDYIDAKFLENMYSEIKRNDVDLVCCDLKTFCDDEKIKNRISNKFIELSNEAALQNMLYQKNITNSACAKLFKTNLFDDIRFPFGKICEDLATTYKVFYKSKKISYTTDKYYYYYQRNDSIIHKDFNINRMIGLEFALEETRFIKEKCPKLLKAAINREFMECYYLLKVIPFEKKYIKEINEVDNIFKSRRKDIIYDIHAPLKSKLIAIISYAGIEKLKKL